MIFNLNLSKLIILLFII